MLSRLISNTTINTENLMKTHGLSVFMPALRSIVENLDGQWECDVPGLETFDDVRCMVKEVEDIDPRSYSFRYPMNKKGAPALPHHYIINVLSFARDMDSVLDLLDGITTALDESWDDAASVLQLRQLFPAEK